MKPNDLINRLKNAKSFRVLTLDDDNHMDWEADYFNPDATNEQDISDIVIAGKYGTLFYDTLENAMIENHTDHIMIGNISNFIKIKIEIKD